jgi:transposase
MIRVCQEDQGQILAGILDGEELLPRDLWTKTVALLPNPGPRRSNHPGRKPLDNRRALAGILYVLWTGIPWESLPRRLGCGSGLNCLRRLHAWQDEGAWRKIRDTIEKEWNGLPRFDFDRAEEHRFFTEDPPMGTLSPQP